MCNKMDESHNIHGKKQDTTKNILYDYIYINFKNIQNLIYEVRYPDSGYHWD